VVILETVFQPEWPELKNNDIADNYQNNRINKQKPSKTYHHALGAFVMSKQKKHQLQTARRLPTRTKLCQITVRKEKQNFTLTINNATHTFVEGQRPTFMHKNGF